ncbi:unnamed protein product [Lymnaea stagnalis]|uniref:WD repeat-containing protein 90 n=1 Tax=Lymnaea stagnalis TaxID=6523 RepID=A0AAV2HT62_LYMST
MENLWQSPFVNVFKHYNLTAWKRASKEGDVISLMDKTVKGTVFRIEGSIHAANYIQLPKTNSQTLALTGRYFYLLFKPIPSKHFVVHLDVATSDNLVIRISFSNLFKSFKSTSTWLKFPFVCCPFGGSLPAYAVDAKRDQSGPAPMITKWTVLCLDLQQILSSYLNRKFLYIKSFKLCANMLVKNVFTSDQLYDPDLTMEEAKRHGLMALNICPLPRDMSYPVGKGENWHDLYDFIRFPSDSTHQPFDTIQANKSKSKLTKFASNMHSAIHDPLRIQTRTVDVSKCVSDRVSMIHKLTAPKEKPDMRKVTKEIPEIPTNINENFVDEIHVYAHPDGYRNHKKVRHEKKMKQIFPPPDSMPTYKALEPNPIMKLKRIIGFGGATFQDTLWSFDGSSVVYPCHAVLVSMKIATGQQRFFIGHTDKVSCLAFTANSSLLASGQTGSMSVVRVWKYPSGECLSISKAHDHSLSCLSFSAKGGVLCGLGKDSHGKNLVVVWNTSRVPKTREMTILAKGHTDVDITRIIIAPFDDTRMVSCGRDNVRMWRIKEGALRSAPVNLGEYHSMEFTDICFEFCSHMDSQPENHLVYACTKSGHIFEMDYNKLTIHHVRRLLPLQSKPGKGTKIKNAAESNAGTMSINAMHLNETFCVTGSDDGYLRLWPLDFAHVYLEAEHEGPVTATRLSADGLKIIAGTSTGNLGVLDVSTRQYTTVMRSHTGRVLSFAIDPMRKHLATVSEDNTIRVWDVETLQQLYDFSAPEECPCSIVYHPSKQIFACGFHSGTIRIFNVESTSLLAEHRQLRGGVTGLAYSPDGSRLYGCCSLGVAIIFDATTLEYKVIRVVAGLVARGDKFGPQALAVSSCSRRVAFVDPTELTVTVADAKCLDELIRIDVSNMSAGSTVMDAAERVTFSPSRVGHMLVTTANNKLIKYEARTGRLLQEVDHIHRAGCSAVTVSDCGQYLATGGDRTIKIWSYDLNLDINFQVFIGHSENVSKIHFTPDGLNLISSGEAIYFWDFLVKRPPTPPVEGRMSANDLDEVLSCAETMSIPDDISQPPQRQPCFPRPKTTKTISPRSDEIDVDNISSIDPASDQEDNPQVLKQKQSYRSREFPKAFKLSSSVQNTSVKDHSQQIANGLRDGLHFNANGSRDGQHLNGGADFHAWSQPVGNQALPDPPKRGLTIKRSDNPVSSETADPSVFVHYKQRQKLDRLAQRRYIAPPNQAGLKLKSVIGFNSNGRNNMVWHPDTGFFAYTSGCVIVIEDLNSGEQSYLFGHTEEISCLALQHDSLCLVSASPAFRDSLCQICVWDTQTKVCTKTLLHHKFGIQCLAFSRDDRFLVSVGDYRENSVVVWSIENLELVTKSMAASAIHSVKWDPFTVNEFVTVGEDGTVLFWLLDETASDVCLNVYEAELPGDLVNPDRKQCHPIAFTSQAYAGDSTMYIGTDSGRVSAWDTRHNTCFMHWEADTAEITKLVSRHSRLMTASCSKTLRLWSVGRVRDMKMTQSLQKASLGVTMEDEMSLDGAITCAEFDDTLDMGIVGTDAGTLWYINWSERTSIRLVSGHKNKINGVAFTMNNLLMSGGDDGSVRVWSLKNREQALQFQVLDQACTCLAAGPSGRKQSLVPLVASGYSDGTVRIFDINKVEMLLKMRPHSVTVTAIAFSADGLMILSGSSDGLLAVSSPTNGMTVRVINDHRGVAISNIDVTFTKDVDVGVTAPTLWLASSMDRRASVWSADWSKDFCELVDWLTFPAPAFMPDGSRINRHDHNHFNLLPPTLARFSPDEADIIVYTGYGMDKSVHFYSLTQRKIVRTVNLTHWSLCMDVSPDSSLIAVGISERLLKLMDYNEGSFQDFTGHSDGVSLTKFSPSGSMLLTVSHNEMFIWEVTL